MFGFQNIQSGNPDWNAVANLEMRDPHALGHDVVLQLLLRVADRLLQVAQLLLDRLLLLANLSRP
jgi:hypothetical protein